MKPKHLIPLAIVLAILLGLVVLKKQTTHTPGIIEQAGLVSLLPEGTTKGDIGKLELYAGAKPDEKVTLAFDGDKWRVTSHFKAPVKEDTIDEYLDDVVKLMGEPRPTSADTDLEDFSLTDEKAFHVVGYKKDAEEALFHVLVGKAEYKSVFMRKEGGNEVFVEQRDLRQKAGVYGDDTEKAPEGTHWFDKEVATFEKDKIMKVALIMPDKSLTFEKREKEQPKEEEEAEEEEDTESADASDDAAEDEASAGADVDASADADVDADVDEEKEPEYEWVLAAGGPPGLEHKQTGLDSLLGKLEPLSASDIVDPEKKADWGLESPSYKCVVSVEGEDEDTCIEGGRPDPSGDGYVRVVGAKDDLVYKLSKYTFEQLFPKGTDLFDLEGLKFDKGKVEFVEVTQAEGNFSLAKGGGKWSVTEPVVDLELNTSKMDSIASTLSSWKPADFADPGLSVGEPTHVAVVTAAGKKHTVKANGEAKHIDGLYVSLDDGQTILTMNRMDADKVFLAPKDLYELDLLDIDEDDIAEIIVAGTAGTFSLARKDDAWTVTVGGETTDANEDLCDSLAEDIVDLEASDILFGQAEIVGGPETTITVKMDDDAEHVLSFGAEKEASHETMVSGKTVVFTVDKAVVDGLFPEVDSLKEVEEPDEVEEATDAEEAAEAAEAEAAEAEAAEEKPAMAEEKPAEAEEKPAEAEAKPVEEVEAAPAAEQSEAEPEGAGTNQ